jgi:hypothetical protein
MEKKELTLEAFQQELGAKFNKWKGNWKEDLFHELLNEYNFEENKFRRESLRIELKELGFFEGGSKGKFSSFLLTIKLNNYMLLSFSVLY